MSLWCGWRGQHGTSQVVHAVVRIRLQCRRHRRCEFDPWVERIPSPVFLLVEFHEQRSLVGYNQQGRKELDVIERLSMHIEGSVVLFIYFWGGGNVVLELSSLGPCLPASKFYPFPFM